MDECAGRLLECICGAHAWSSRRSFHSNWSTRFQPKYLLCLQVQDQGNATHLPMFTCLPKSPRTSDLRGSKAERRVSKFILGTCEKRTRWRRQHIERWLRSILQLKIRCYSRSFHSNWPALGRPQRLANTLRLSSVIPFLFFFLSFSTLEYFATELRWKQALRNGWMMH